MSPGAWTVVFGRSAARDMRRLDPAIRGRALVELEEESRTIKVVRVLPRGRAYDR